VRKQSRKEGKQRDCRKGETQDVEGERGTKEETRAKVRSKPWKEMEAASAAENLVVPDQCSR
jgi:hypothetical protein